MTLDELTIFIHDTNMDCKTKLPRGKFSDCSLCRHLAKQILLYMANEISALVRRKSEIVTTKIVRIALDANEKHPAALAEETRKEAETVTGRALKDIAYWLKWFEDAWRSDMEVSKSLHARIAQLQAQLDAANERFRFYGVSAEEDLETGIDNVYVKGTEAAEAALTQARQTIQQQIYDAENLEASLYPEDVGFAEYIPALQKQLTAAHAQKSALMEALEPFAKVKTHSGQKFVPLKYEKVTIEDFRAAARVYEQVKEKI